MVLNTQMFAVTEQWQALELNGADSVTIVLEGNYQPVKVRVQNTLPLQTTTKGITLDANRESIGFAGLAQDQRVYLRSLSGQSEVAIS